MSPTHVESWKGDSAQRVYSTSGLVSNCILLLILFIVYHYYTPSSLTVFMLHFLTVFMLHFIILLTLFIQRYSPPVTSFTVTITPLNAWVLLCVIIPWWRYLHATETMEEQWAIFSANRSLVMSATQAFTRGFIPKVLCTLDSAYANNTKKSGFHKSTWLPQIIFCGGRVMWQTSGYTRLIIKCSVLVLLPVGPVCMILIQRGVEGSESGIRLIPLLPE